jgi:hypothetical protein
MDSNYHQLVERLMLSNLRLSLNINAYSCWYWMIYRLPGMAAVGGV